MTLAQISITTLPANTRFADYDNLLSGLASGVLQYGIYIGGLYFLLRLVIAGFNYLTSIGDPAKVQATTKSLTNAATGLFVVISAYFIAQIINYLFGTRLL